MVRMTGSTPLENPYAVRRQLILDRDAYHTAIDQQPSVWHTDVGCPAGQQIEVQNVRGGKGDKERLCELCRPGWGAGPRR